ncbi:MAG: hypothetical protein PUH84_01835 [Firmicutes bacterium]|nr:hypothetical protein [Bacillota bacterium]MDY5335573.1 hypothetical protein [Bacilli bacterium]
MTERLQNIINGINDGSIKFVFDYNLTMEDLFTKDNDGIYFLEYLLRKRIMMPLELKEELKTNALAAYLYCKNGSSLFGFNLSEKDLFTEFDGKKLIEHILEKKQINKSIVESIYENLEIIDLLCNSNNYFYLNYLSQDIITKLITKDNNGIYPIEKYLNNKRLIEKIMPSINDINVLLEICNRNNNYDLIKAVKARMLITNYKDDKTILLFLLNDKKVVPDCLNKIPEDIIFIKYLIENNLYDYLKKASEDVLLMKVDSGKTLLEFLIDKGYDPEIKYIYNKKTIIILYRKQKLNLAEFVSDDVLLTPVKKLFSDDSLGDETLFEYMIRNGYKLNSSRISSEKLLKICYLEQRPDLLEEASISDLLKPIDDTYTYFDYILDSIANKGLKIRVPSRPWSSDVNEHIEYYTTIAKHDMMKYIGEIKAEKLLKKYGDKTLLEYLLDTDSDLTLNKILSDDLKADPDIAVILKKRGIVQKSVNVSKEENEYTTKYIENINNHLGIGPLPEEGERLLNELKLLFLTDGKSDKDLITGLTAGYRNALMNNYDINIIEIKKLIEIKKENKDIFYYIKNDDGSYFSPSNGSIFCENANTNTLLHETGHALHFYIADMKTPDNYQEIVERARENPEVLAKTKEYAANYRKLINNITLLVEQRYDSFFKSYYSPEKVEEIKKNLTKSKEEKKKEYKELHIPDEQLDMILSDMYTQEEYIDHQKRIFIEDNVDAILRNEFGSLLPIGDILDAIYEGKLHSNTLKDSQGEAICKTGGHGLNYYYATLHGFDEMIANFAAISKANDAKEKLKMLKSIVGDEVYDMISNFYYHDILKLNTEELEENKVYGGKR